MPTAVRPPNPADVDPSKAYTPTYATMAQLYANNPARMNALYGNVSPEDAAAAGVQVFDARPPAGMVVGEGYQPVTKLTPDMFAGPNAAAGPGILQKQLGANWATAALPGVNFAPQNVEQNALAAVQSAPQTVQNQQSVNPLQQSVNASSIGAFVQDMIKRAMNDEALFQ